MDRYNDELEIDLKDLIAEFLTKWIYILFSCVLVAAIMLAYAFVKDVKLATRVPAEERLASARKSLNDDEAAEVERVFQQHMSYAQYKESLQKYYNDYLFVGDNFSDYIEKDTVFCMSTNVYGADSIISKLSLSPEVFEEINKILPEDEAVATIDKRVVIYSSEKNSITLLNDDEDGVFLPNEYVLTLSIVAKTQDQCDKIEKIVKKSMDKMFSLILSIDENATLSLLGSNYVDNLAEWLVNRQTEAINSLNNVENAIKNFNNNQVSNLSDNQKKYYNELLSTMNEEDTDVSKTSKLKYLIVGVLGGGIIACGYILLKYIFDESIKTENDISYRYNIPVLKMIPVKEKRYFVFDTIVGMLRNAGNQDKEKAIEIVATDIGILTEKNESSSLYIVNTSESDNAQKTIEILTKHLKNKYPAITVLSGTPEKNAEDMIVMAKSENVILFIETRNTKIDSADYYYNMMCRYNSDVLGAIVLRAI